MTQAPDDLGFELPPPARTSRARVLGAIVIVVAGVFAFGYFRHRSARGEPAGGRGEGSAVRVEVVTPKLQATDRVLELPGVVRPLEEAKIYPRTTGYVRRWLVDIGDQVKAGQLLAEIDTPELDAQLAQARAQLAQSRATVKQASAQRDFSKSSSARYETLANQSLVSKAQVEQTQAQAATDEANVAASESAVAAAEANVRRLVELKGFANVTAPFNGTVTQRSIDRGALVGTGGTTPLYTIVATDPVRVFVEVPQTVAPNLQVGTEATLAVREYATRKFTGKVTRTSRALDPELHTMTTEIQVPNSDGALLPGMYVTAGITLAVPRQVVEIPATALYNDSQGLRVAMVDSSSRIHFAPITIERDTGGTLWIATGLTGSERIVKIAVASLVEGDLVEVTERPVEQAREGSAQAPKPR